MLLGEPKTIYLISPQRWDALKVSKHHYARELGSLGHSVFYIEPPGSGRGFDMSSTDAENVMRVSYKTWFPYALKFRSRRLFDLAMRRQARSLVAAIGRPPDIVWDFDNSYQFSDLRAFGAPVKIFHLVDQPMKGRTGMKGADLMVAAGRAYLDAIDAPPARAHVVPHGLGVAHADFARRIADASDDALAPRKTGRVRAAFVGNLESMAFDGETVLALARSNPNVTIMLIGPYRPERKRDPGDVMAKLASQENVKMMGRLEAADILVLAADIDIWLISYDRNKTPDGSVNPHKILEYMATGRAILSSRLDTHADRDDLVYMAPTRDNGALPTMLGDLAQRMDDINAPQRQRRRAEYALRYSYSENIKLIDRLLAVATPK